MNNIDLHNQNYFYVSVINMAKSMTLDPNRVRAIASKYQYKPIPMKVTEDGYMLSFEHHNMLGCGGAMAEVNL